MMKMKAIVGLSKILHKSSFSFTLFSTVPRYSETQGGMVPDTDSKTVKSPSTGKPYDRADVAKNKSAHDEDSGFTGYMAEKAREGTAKAADTIINTGEKVKETADDLWGAAKDTAHKIKETVEDDGKADDVAGRYYKPTDSHVEDLRKHNGGYDPRSD